MSALTRIKVVPRGSLAALDSVKSGELAFEAPVTLAEAAGRMGVPSQLVMLYSVNGALRPPDYEPADGDEVMLIPAVAGGAGRD